MSLLKVLAIAGFILFSAYFRWLAWKWVSYLVAVAQRCDMDGRLRAYHRRETWVAAAFTLPLCALVASVVISRTLPGILVVLAMALALAPGCWYLLNQWEKVLRPLGYGVSAWAWHSHAKPDEGAIAGDGLSDSHGMTPGDPEWREARRRFLPIFWGSFGVALSLNAAIFLYVYQQERSIVLLLAGAVASAVVAVLFVTVIGFAQRRFTTAARKRKAADKAVG